MKKMENVSGDYVDVLEKKKIGVALSSYHRFEFMRWFSILNQEVFQLFLFSLMVLTKVF